jgi:transposase-like protein
MILEPISCPTWGQDDIIKHVRSGEGKQRYKCRHPDCSCQTVILDPSYRGHLVRFPQVYYTARDCLTQNSYSRPIPLHNP